MSVSSSREITRLLIAWNKGDVKALEQLTPLVHTELHRMARHYMAGERHSHILQTTALINEAYLRLIDWGNVEWRDRSHFFGLASQIMRRILVEFARARRREKRGGEALRVSLSKADHFTSVRTGAPQVWRMGIDGSDPVQLTDDSDAQMSDISPDGKWAFYTSHGIWKIPVAGGKPVKIQSEYNPIQPSLSPDGKLIAYHYREKQPGAKFKIAVTPSSGGRPVLTFDPPREDFWTFDIRWTRNGMALLYEADHDGVSNIWLKPLNGGEPKRLTDFRSETIFSFDLSPDGKHLICTRGGWTFDLVMIRDISVR